MSEWVQDPPNSIQVEFVEGCNLYCDFCGLQGIREPKDKTYKEMTFEIASLITEQITQAKWTSRIEFAMHGEPTMHEDYVGLVRLFRTALPKNQLMMTSNGGGLLPQPNIVPRLNALFDAGLNIFAFDAYEGVTIKDKMLAALGDESGPMMSFALHQYPDESEWSPHTRRPIDTRALIWIRDISIATRGTHSDLSNHCGAAFPPLVEPLIARCAKPFRELAIRWDGSVAICCEDWRGVFKVGNVIQDGLVAVWQHPRFHAARRLLMTGDRAAIDPCRVCNDRSYRVGLLPDRMGHRFMGPPTDADRALVAEASAGEPLTVPVARPWEQALPII